MAKNEYFCFWARQLYYYNCARVKLFFIGVFPNVVFFPHLKFFGFWVYNRGLAGNKGKATITPQNQGACKVPKTCYNRGFNTQHTERFKMTAKTVNYTPEQTTKMVADYLAGATAETIATELGKTVRSVVAKLSREGVYKAKTYVSKTGAPVVKKDAHADAIGAILKMSENEIESLTKANKTALEKIFSALANSKPI